jgi:hypothetical protein
MLYLSSNEFATCANTEASCWLMFIIRTDGNFRFSVSATSEPCEPWAPLSRWLDSN